MKKYVKNKENHDESSFESKKISEAMKRRKRGRKVPTSVALDPELVEKLKAEAENRGIPYQVLLRMFIVEGFKKMRKTG